MLPIIKRMKWKFQLKTVPIEKDQLKYLKSKASSTATTKLLSYKTFNNESFFYSQYTIESHTKLKRSISLNFINEMKKNYLREMNVHETCEFSQKSCAL